MPTTTTTTIDVTKTVREYCDVAMNVTAAKIAKSLTAIPVDVLLQFIRQPSAAHRFIGFNVAHQRTDALVDVAVKGRAFTAAGLSKKSP
jgi:hypothetical protein